MIPILAAAGCLYAIHVITQPSLGGETNWSENLRTIPILRPLSWSVQWSNLLQKWDVAVTFAPQIVLLLLACAEGLRCPDLSKAHKQTMILLMLPLLGWLFIEPAGPSSYLIHFLPCLVIASMIGIDSVLVGTRQRIVVGSLALLSLAFGFRDALIAEEVGGELTRMNTSALSQATIKTGSAPLIVMNAAQSSLQDRTLLGTTHFIELPNTSAQQLTGEGFLLSYNSSIQPGFMWEVVPLRREITSPELTLSGHYLDVGRSYFNSLNDRHDTLFLQRVNLNGLYKRHIR